jgi:hypothetical protein
MGRKIIRLTLFFSVFLAVVAAEHELSTIEKHCSDVCLGTAAIATI